MPGHRACIVLIFLGLLTSPAFSQIDVEFDTIQGFSRIRFSEDVPFTRYEAVRYDGVSALHILTDGSAGGLVLSDQFNVYDDPQITWRWKVAHVIAAGDLTKKEGDDYAVRIYVLFRFDPQEARLGTRLKYAAAKLIYGEYPPEGALNYIWANQPRSPGFYPNPFSDRSMMIPVDAGSRLTGSWQTHSRNIVEDYRDAFGEDPPAHARLAVMGDSDNTGGHSEAWIDYVRVGPPGNHLTP